MAAGVRRAADLLKRSWQAHKWLYLLLGVAFVAYCVVSISKHVHFQSTGYDLTIFDQAIRHYSQFKEPASSLRGFENLLGDHFHPILAVLAPLYWLMDSPVVLLVAQAALVTFAALPVFLYARRRFGERVSLALTTVFLANASLINLIHFDFHEIAFAVPLIAWGLYFMETRRWVWLYACLGLLLLTKESFGLYVATVGLYVALFKGERVRGLLIAVAGIAAFFVTTKLLIPHFAGGTAHGYWTYTGLGADLPSALLTIATNPLMALGMFFVPFVKLATLVKSFGVFLFLPLLSPIVLLSVPLLAERFLSTNENYWQSGYHYGATIVPILAFAFISVLHKIATTNRIKPSWRVGSVRAIVVLSLLLTAAFALRTPATAVFDPANYSLSNDEKAGYALIGKIPSDASVCTTNHVAPHVGKHDLILLGFNRESPVNVDCEYFLVSNVRDQSPYLREREVIDANRFTVVECRETWCLYGR